MFAIKRFEVEDGSSKKGVETTKNDRLALLNARFKKNKKLAASQREEESPAPPPLAVSPTKEDTPRKPKLEERQKDRDLNNNSKRGRNEKEEPYQQGKTKKWEKRSKELKDSDLIPNDVREAMKAQLEAAKKGLSEAATSTLPSEATKTTESTAISGGMPALGSLGDSGSLGSMMELDEDQLRLLGAMGEDVGKLDQPQAGGKEGEAEEAAVSERKMMSAEEEQAALDGIAALVPLPTFEVKEVSAEELKMAKSMGVPAWLAQPTTIEPDVNTPIESPIFGFSPRLVKQCHKAGITECFAVQTAVIPVLLRARHLGDIRKAPGDLCVSAPTGSGKTLAYVLPIIEILSQRVVTRLRALIVLPTRDLCVQVKETFETFIKGTDLKVATTTGQSSFANEQSLLVGDLTQPKMGGDSRIDIMITTPGRLIDHIKSTPNFTLQHLRFLVIDEADRLLNQSFQDWLHHILTAIHPSAETTKKSLLENQPLGAVQLQYDALGFPVHDAVAPGFLPSYFHIPESDMEDPKVLSVQKLLFSATLTRNPAKIASLQLADPQYVAVQEQGQEGEKQKYTTPAGLTENMIVCDTSEKPLMVLHLLHHLNVRSALCFTKSVESAHRLYKLVQLFERQRLAKRAKMTGQGEGDAPSLSTDASAKEGDEESMSVDENSEAEESDSEEEEDNGSNHGSGDEADSGSDSDSESSDGEATDGDEEGGKTETKKRSKDKSAGGNGMEVDEKEQAILNTEPIIVAEFSSDLPKAKRAAVLRQFNAGEIHLLICSDLISRGMDLGPVSVVINYDSPVYMKKYIHRVGRTARAGKTGTAYSLVEMQEARHFKEMMTKAGHMDKISRIKVTHAETKDLVPGYEQSLAGLKDALSGGGSGVNSSKHGGSRYRRK
ncbi:ATP-dependent RNA helicase dbp6 [Actinomortierella ambigua]|uniref:ATP-dependent RNA helicase n=1 Tax=Actinomortierella ambigua TaxID=1343610 RepID=A0A9P6Q3N9_9FUNG|nr:ATP-dependent RNA helicase dbp6 [Actinomortierella ambigua]